MSSKPYTESIASSKLADDYVIVGIDGERWQDWSEPDDPRHNYTYVNWMGKSTYEGYPNTHRESPALVAELIEALKAQTGCERVFVGGHSQGGFLSWFLAMHHPELVSGTFRCLDCQTMIKNVEQQFKFTQPTICRNEMCANRSRWVIVNVPYSLV